ncbi:MAG TPA: HEAT repeat domain-containing protein [Thermoanaerobaculia bacterium]|nr:HEAT repeat domain-containing protein [Thermoanaerobaculia bacterium]
MPLLLIEALDPAQRERTHQHIEHCAACGDQWSAYRETWDVLATLPEVEVPAGVKTRFLESIGQDVEPVPNRFAPARSRRYVSRWLAEAAAVVIVASGAFYAGHRTMPMTGNQTPATINTVSMAPYSIAESRVLPASEVSPNIEGRPNIENVSFTDTNPADPDIDLSFDITSHVTVTGRPTDKSMVHLVRYVLENENRVMPSRSRAIDVVRTLYSQPGNADPEIADALANVLRNDSHEGVRIKAVETLNRLPVSTSADTRQALIEALKGDPNPAVRIKAVEALANLARSGAQFDSATLETLRQKAVQNDENVYVRVKAAEALSNIHP